MSTCCTAPSSMLRLCFPTACAGMQRAQEIMAAADAHAQHTAERTRGGLARGLMGGRASTFTSFASGAHSHGADHVMRSLSGVPFTMQQALSRQTTAKSGFSLSLKTGLCGECFLYGSNACAARLALVVCFPDALLVHAVLNVCFNCTPALQPSA